MGFLEEVTPEMKSDSWEAVKQAIRWSGVEKTFQEGGSADVKAQRQESIVVLVRMDRSPMVGNHRFRSVLGSRYFSL